MGSCVGVPVPSARPQQPRVTELETTMSTCTTEAMQRKHVFEIQGYRSLLSRLAPGDFIRSATFEVGGFDWAVNYYPYGDPSARPGYASVSVELMTPRAEAWASCELSLVPWSSTAGVAPTPVSSRTAPRLFSQVNDSRSGSGPSLVKRRKLEAPAYLRDDTIRIECAVNVFKKPSASVTLQLPPPPPPEARVEEPPPELSSYLAKLLDPKEGAQLVDVHFHVGSEYFPAHRLVLWARCRKLYDRTTVWPVVKISASEVPPFFFKALLHYIYTESLPAMDDLSVGGKAAMLRSLLTTADLYGMDKLKLSCKNALAGRQGSCEVSRSRTADSIN